MKNKFLLLLPILTILVGCGILSSEPYIKTFYFDIGTPNSQIKTNKYVIDDISFSTSTMYLEKIVFRVGENTILFDDFNRWSMPPNSLLKRYFIIALQNRNTSLNKNIKHYNLQGEILQIEADIPQKTVSLILRITLLDNKKNNLVIWKEIFKQKQPVQEVTGKSFALAIKTSVDNIINELNMFTDKTVK